MNITEQIAPLPQEPGAKTLAANEDAPRSQAGFAEAYGQSQREHATDEAPQQDAPSAPPRADAPRADAARMSQADPATTPSVQAGPAAAAVVEGGDVVNAEADSPQAEPATDAPAPRASAAETGADLSVAADTAPELTVAPAIEPPRAPIDRRPAGSTRAQTDLDAASAEPETPRAAIADAPTSDAAPSDTPAPDATTAVDPRAPARQTTQGQAEPAIGPAAPPAEAAAPPAASVAPAAKPAPEAATDGPIAPAAAPRPAPNETRAARDVARVEAAPTAQGAAPAASADAANAPGQPGSTTANAQAQTVAAPTGEPLSDAPAVEPSLRDAAEAERGRTASAGVEAARVETAKRAGDVAAAAAPPIASADGPARADATAAASALAIGEAEPAPQRAERLSAAGPAIPAAPANAAQAPVVAAQLALAVLKRGEPGAVELRLDPPELGKVRLELRFDSADQVSITVHAERPETLDLLRRGADALDRDLRDAGLSLADLDFASSGGFGADDASSDAVETPVPWRDGSGRGFDGARVAVQAGAPSGPLTGPANDRLDLRI